MFQVRVTAESAPRDASFWTLNNESVIFETLLGAQSYVLFLETKETEKDKSDPYYQKFGPLIQILTLNDQEIWEVLV